MENNLDKLFRDQLLNHKETPSTDAWDKIDHSLKAKKQRIWLKRLSIAASIILIATIGIVSQQMLSDLQQSSGLAESNKNVEKHEEEAGNKQEILADTQNSEIAEKSKLEVQNEYIPKGEHKDTQSTIQIVRNEIASVEQSANPVSEESEEKKEIMESQEEQSIAILNNKIDEPIEQEVILAENSNLNKPTETVVESNSSREKEKKSLPQIRIVYKANQDSKLVQPEKTTIINKGINKLTEFSDEHILTADRKTKLRNTKEDLLALNFSKILSKTNKDVEN